LGLWINWPFLPRIWSAIVWERTSLSIAVQNPQRVRSLATIGTSGFCEPAGADEFEPEWLVEHGMQTMIDQMNERHIEAGSEALVVPGYSHKPHMIRENPVFVNDAILRFLEKCNA